MATGAWKLSHVAETYVNEYIGHRIATFVAGEWIKSTYHHPFWVVRGEDLENRPTPDHVASATVKNAAILGRWVTAGDLRVGDVLLLQDGRRLPIEQIFIRHADATVYKFAVEPYHTYAVGHAHVLVHNSTCDPNAIEIHHLLPQAKKLAPFFKNAGLDIEKFTIPLTRGAHRLKEFNGIHTGPDNWNALWKRFFKDNKNASAPEILDQLAMMRQLLGYDHDGEHTILALVIARFHAQAGGLRART